MTDSIEITGLRKSFKNVEVLSGIDLTVNPGSVFALLGANGAGKTTMVRILCTLLKPDAGTVRIYGVDVLGQPARLREIISLTGQFAAVDEVLTGRENLLLIARLRHLDNAKELAAELLDRFELADAADRAVATYSGGMKRRLDLAMSLLGDPKVLFLDEPTTGLDPQARAGVWKMIRELKKTGTTIFLTTQYLEEADQLADEIAILNHGKIVAQGTPAELKNTLPHGTIELSFATVDLLNQAADTLTRHCEPVGRVSPEGELNDGIVRHCEPVGRGNPENELTMTEQTQGLDCHVEMLSPRNDVNKHPEMLTLSISTDGSVKEIATILTELDSAGIPVAEFSQKQPTLDDVFFSVIEGAVK